MKLVVDTAEATLTLEDGGEQRSMALYSREAFEELSRQWVKVGWALKYSYTFSWLGRPIIQLPEDMVRLQEVIYRLQPDVILETGVAHGGSLIFSASLCQLLGKGRVIGVDIEIRPANRAVIESHPMAGLITLIEGNSVAPEVVRRVKTLIRPEEVVLVVLDSNHSREHVLAELEAYHDLVSAGSYIIATDGIMRDLHDVPQGSSEWCWDNPAAAAAAFLERHPEFALEQPVWLFNESPLQHNVTHWPGAWLRRKQKE